MIAALPDRGRQGLRNLGYQSQRVKIKIKIAPRGGEIFDLNPQGMIDINHVLISLFANDTCPFGNVRGGGQVVGSPCDNLIQTINPSGKGNDQSGNRCREQVDHAVTTAGEPGT